MKKSYSSLKDRIIQTMDNNPKYVDLSFRELVICLTEQFWKEDNTISRFGEPPSMLYEIVESTLTDILK